MGHVVVELVFVGDDFHRPPAEHEAGADQDGIADFAGDLAGFVDVARDAVVGLLEVELLKQVAELLAIAGFVEGIDGRAEDGNARFRETAREVQRRLAAELDDDAFDQILAIRRRPCSRNYRSRRVVRR